MRRWLSALFVGTLLVAPAARADSGSIGQVQESISGGTLDLTDKSVFFTVTHLDNGYGALCTATLIAPNLLLTARHCVSLGGSEQVICGVSAFTSTVSAQNYYATNDAEPSDASSWFQGLDVRVPSEGAESCGFDVALVVLSSNVPGTTAKPAIPRIDEEVQPGESYTAVGYGIDDSGQPTGARMVRSNLSVQCAPGFCSAYGAESTEFLGETGICSGDSGGPAFDSERRVVGVVSRGSDGCDTPIYGTVTAWRDWLMSNAVDAANLGKYEPPFWALSGSSVPPATGSGGSSGNPPPTNPGADGTSCAAASDCAGGFACYFESNPSDAVCRQTCTANSECSGGTVCKSLGSSGVCLTATGSADDSGCSLARPDRNSATPQVALSLAALLSLAGLRRRRRSKPT
ncbi:MAG TPA: S1 family peptidase [Polyangiaceae bacterium]|jgi:V8-like Glu-specific endopeptidase|nr:S1 family peptidase [Polyangiaceae bacterium]